MGVIGPMTRTVIRGSWLALLMAATFAHAGAPSIALAAADDPWPELARDIFNGRTLEDGSGLITLDAPYRAEDAAIVPLTVRATLPAGDTRRVEAITIVIDKNPAPVAATFKFGDASGVSSISTRVRIDMYTNVRAVAALSDGKHYMVAAFVKASGGCSAPALKTADEAKQSAGQMRLRQFARATDGPASGAREAQLMVRHPNYSGLQIDQLTRFYIPVYFVRELRIWQGDDLVLSMEGGISISEDPSIRFNYLPNGAKSFRAEVVDTDNRVFKAEWPVEASGT
jgi:sulfur-oxidizing protein SoxY